MKDNTRQNSEELNLWKYQAVYFSGALILVAGIISVVIFLFNISSISKVFISVILLTSVSYFLGKFSDEFLDFVLTEEQKERARFYKVKWRSKNFDEFVGEDLIELYQDSEGVFQFIGWKELDGDSEEAGLFSDHSFMLLPIAKAYEGVLKKILIENKILTEEDLASNPAINVGAYFNPISNEKLFNLLKDKARDRAIPHVIYSTYQECRNQIFHYDQFRDSRIKKYGEAVFYKKRILDAIYKAYDTFCS